MQNIILSFMLLFSLTSCGDSEKQIAEQKRLTQEIQAEKEALLAEIKAKDIALDKARNEANIAQERVLMQEKAKKEAFIREQARKAQAEKEALAQKKSQSKLSRVGIEVDESKITIDTNKTKAFFKQLGKSFEKKINKIGQDIQNGIIDQKEAGVKIDESHINIDLNKTKNFLENMSKTLQGFAENFNPSPKENN